MADLTAIRSRLAAQITAKTGLRCDGQARDQVSPPCAVVIPGSPYAVFGSTMDGALTVNLAVLVIIGDGPPAEQAQAQLDSWLGISPGGESSVPDAVMADTTLGGAVDFIEPVSIASYGRLEYAGVQLWGSKILFTAGAT